MAFVQNGFQQISLLDNYNSLSERAKKYLEKSWAPKFAETIFPAINEARFSVLYSTNEATRPNSPVNVTIGALILKEVFGTTDDELLENIVLDVRYQHALHTTSFKEQPFSDRTPSRFREKLYNYELETGIDLLKEEIKSLAVIIAEFMELDCTMKRMDSIMISSNCKKMARLELVYTCVENMVKAVNATGETGLLIDGLTDYLLEGSKNDTIYRSKPDKAGGHLEKVVFDALKLLELCGDSYSELEEYKLLTRMVKEQTIDKDGKIIVKPSKEIVPDSLQNPSDPDATYRNKAGKDHTGYVGNMVETFDQNGAVITQYDYQPNSHSDSEFCREVIEELGTRKETVTLIADGAYSGTENSSLAEQNNIDLVTTNLTGKIPDKIKAGFELDENNKTMTKCPAGCTPKYCTYYEKQDRYRANFDKETCSKCPCCGKCGVKFQNKDAVLIITPKTIQRAEYLTKLSTADYKKISNKRNGVEGIPSILRRRFSVDHIKAKGHLRSKIWFSFKIAAINATRLFAFQ